MHKVCFDFLEAAISALLRCKRSCRQRRHEMSTTSRRFSLFKRSNRIYYVGYYQDGRRRTVPLSETAMYLLNARRGKSTSECVFALNDRQINAGWVTHLSKRYVRRAGLDDRLRFHSLRHTFARWLVQDGVSLYEVQKLLGHSSSALTEVYSHLQPEQVHSTVNRIDIALN